MTVGLFYLPGLAPMIMEGYSISLVSFSESSQHSPGTATTRGITALLEFAKTDWDIIALSIHAVEMYH